MVRSQFPIKILGVHFGNYVLDNPNWNKISHSLTKKINISNRVRLSLGWKKRKKNCKPNAVIQTLVYRSNIYCSKIYQKEIEKKIAQLSIWKCGLGILDIDTQLNSLELKWNWRLLNPTNVLWKGLMLHWLNLKNNSNQGLSLFRQKQMLRSSRHKSLQNQSNEDFFRKHNTIYRIKCNADNKTQSFKM